MEACEVRGVFGLFVLGEGRAEIGPGGVAQCVDRRFCLAHAVEGERREDGDKGMAHRAHRPRRTGRWAGNGPAHCILPTDLIPRRTRAPTSAGIWKAFTIRPAQGCSPPPKCR